MESLEREFDGLEVQMAQMNFPIAKLRWHLLFALSFMLWQAAPIQAQADVLDSAMDHDPELPQAKIAHVFPENVLATWLAALRRPEVDYQYRAALTILLAHKEGLDGIKDAIDPLLETLMRPDQKAVVRLAAAQALIELDARRTAPPLLQQAHAGDQDIRDLIETALAKWKFQPAKEIWLDRLRQPDTSGSDLVLAIRGLAALRESEAISFLVEIVHS